MEAANGPVAVMDKLAMTVWHVLRDKVPRRSFEARYIAKRGPEPAVRGMPCEANYLGLTMRFQPISSV
ncbi:hypothetical protein [Streptomyces avermitilis]|uniref:hypothetical protein n=1 Tax=Streptomyces avermitilis TaxID=33903 RepID=UPI0033AECBA6